MKQPVKPRGNEGEKSMRGKGRSRSSSSCEYEGRRLGYCTMGEQGERSCGCFLRGDVPTLHFSIQEEPRNRSQGNRKGGEKKTFVRLELFFDRWCFAWYHQLIIRKKIERIGLNGSLRTPPRLPRREERGNQKR